MIQKISIAILLALTFIADMPAQSVSVGFGPAFTHTAQRVRMVHSRDDFMNTAYQTVLSYEHFFDGSKFSLAGVFSRFKGCNFIRFYEGSYIGGDGFSTLATGFCGVYINRYDLVLHYNLLGSGRKGYVKPFAGIGVQLSRDLGYEYGNFELIDGPDYFQLAPIVAQAFNTAQAVPVLGFKAGYAFWGRLDISLTVQGVYGFRSYQDLYFEYAYKGVEQEMAVFEATGTGVFVSLGLGYRFKKQR